MVYEYMLRLFGKNIVQFINFLPLVLGYTNGKLAIGIHLTNPITKECHALCEQGFVFGIEYYISVIVGERKVHNATVVKKLRYNKKWFCNDTLVSTDSLQNAMGSVTIIFSDVGLQHEERIEIFIRATILPDKGFKESTGLNTDVLWNCYVPRIDQTYVLRKGTLVVYEP